MKYLGLIALLVLSACGGSTHYEDHTPVTPPPPPPVVTLDAFYTAVLAIIGDGSETSSEPIATDSIVATAPEDTEPVAYK
ncbi:MULTISPECIES: hypothetical protein [unclassified Duganella]|uniref:hypothetical protein n=1 Tax=unclassified Duganella TaxID=2636909 RepID=UPI000E34C2AF|nr:MULTISPECIES: hypothetical protein [unclassified Duganella]RFP12875.1 hypothetical protein D0T23_17460 [Duganella sp. BJB475]RFP28884.1 hypothetical protein D0T21_21445 [Duganella sp. BJB476]